MKWLEVWAKPLSFLVLSIDFLVMEATWLAKKCWNMSVVCEKRKVVVTSFDFQDGLVGELVVEYLAVE